jgi:hypothetical protein
MDIHAEVFEEDIQRLEYAMSVLLKRCNERDREIERLKETSNKKRFGEKFSIKSRNKVYKFADESISYDLNNKEIYVNEEGPVKPSYLYIRKDDIVSYYIIGNRMYFQVRKRRKKIEIPESFKSWK